MRKIFYVTGCLGFIGGHLTRKLLASGHLVIGVDKITYASNVDVATEFEIEYPGNFRFVAQDIACLERLEECDYVINVAAETHVDNSIESSNEFIHSNIEGVHNLLKLIAKKREKKPIFFHFSTDEVYGDIAEGAFKETDRLNPSNPYAASKAAADMLITAWGRTHGVPYVIVRPTNNYGPDQYVEKLIPKACKFLQLGRKVPLHQQGRPKRTWLHVLDTVDAVMSIINNGSVNEVFNISGNYEDMNIIVVEKIINYMGLSQTRDWKEQYIDFTYDRPGQDVRYAIDDSKLKALGWEPTRVFDSQLKQLCKERYDTV